MPKATLYVILLIFSGLFLVALIQVGAITIAFDKLGISPQTGLLLLFGSLFGSGINLPIYFRKRTITASQSPDLLRMLPWGVPRDLPDDRTLIAVNLGGCLIPVGVSLYLFTSQPLGLLTTLFAIAGVTLVSYVFSRPITGIGIGMPIFLAPLTSAILGLSLDPAHSAPLAYISGTLGVLLGADLLHLRLIGKLGVRVASIGGAGTFDGIFFTGIIAALLA